MPRETPASNYATGYPIGSLRVVCLLLKPQPDGLPNHQPYIPHDARSVPAGPSATRRLRAGCGNLPPAVPHAPPTAPSLTVPSPHTFYRGSYLCI
jgi:hypothetical protein